MCSYCDAPITKADATSRAGSKAMAMIERERIDERRMREKYERALERIANGRNGVKPLEDFEAQEIAQDALRGRRG